MVFRKCAVVVPAVLGLAVLTPACQRRPAPAERFPERPNVVFITVDTLRADRLGSYGSRTVRTPVMDALAAEGLLFENAVAPLPETRPSHYTLFTSLYPNDHGVVSNLFPPVPDLVTLPAVYRRAGYDTVGFAGCALFDEAAGSALGFEQFDGLDEDGETTQRNAGEVVPAAIRWLEAHGSDRPFFLWLHLFDPHMPYVPPPPFNGKSAPEKVKSLPSFSWPRLYGIAEKNDGDLPRPVAERALDLYAGEVEYVDHWLGRFFDALEAAGLYEDALIVLTADHGECFENGVFFDHSPCLGEGALAVPLILRYPRRLAPARSPALVEHLDVAPTLLALSGLEAPAAFQGRDLLEGADDVAAAAFFQHPLYRRIDIENRREVLTRLRSVDGEPTRPIAGDRLHFGVRRGPWKYLRSGEEERLYNLDVDPREQADVAAREGEVTRELRHAAWLWMKEHPFRLPDPGDLDPKLVERLKALGYL